MEQPRFEELPGGQIRDRLTGQSLLTIHVGALKSAEAQRIVAAILDGLHRNFGPLGAGQRPMPIPKK